MDAFELVAMIWLDRHILAYMWNRGFQSSASAFAQDAPVDMPFVAMDGSLISRWRIFCDTYFSYQVLPPQSLADQSRSPPAMLARLDTYILNYLRWKGLSVAGDIFVVEAQVHENAVGLLSLYDRWKQFYNLFLIMYHQSFWQMCLGGRYEFLNNPQIPSSINQLFVPQNLAYRPLPPSHHYPVHNSHTGPLSVYRVNPLQFDIHTPRMEFSPYPNVDQFPRPQMLLPQESGHSKSESTSQQGGHETVPKDLSLREVVTLNTSKDKILCCHFSSNGKLLASGGQSKMVSIWNIELCSHIGDTRKQSSKITDVRFRPHSTIFATCSDTTLRIWDADNVSYNPTELQGHTHLLTSVDFSENETNVVWSCDCNGEIRMWNLNDFCCTNILMVTDGCIRQVLFLSKTLLAVASTNLIVMMYGERKKYEHLEGHTKDVESISCDESGTYLASVSQESARVWSRLGSSGWRCEYELHSTDDMFRCCTFHPARHLLLVIGCYQIIKLWDCVEGTITQTIKSHTGFISALSYSPEAELIASTSNDGHIKLWRL